VGDVALALAGLFPAGARTAAVRCDESAVAVLHADEREALGAAVPRRVRTHAGGRAAARLVVPVEGPLLNDGDGVPRWPTGVVASIAHCDRWAMAVALDAAEAAGVGVDVEEAGGVGPEEAPIVLSAREARRWPRHATVVFCAKEATYKALFPRDRTMLDFHDVEIELDVGGGRFVATVAGSGERVPGRWAEADGLVLAGAVRQAAG
jgi:4'-phosphopantetheinyl transferase EntD